MNKIPGTGNQYRVTGGNRKDEQQSGTKVLKTTYCINKITNGYKDVEKNHVAYALILHLVRSGTRSKYREI